MARVPCLDAAEGLFKTFRRQYETARPGRGRVDAAHTAWIATERDMIRSYGTNRRIAEAILGTRATLSQVLYGLRPPSDIFPEVFYSPIQSALRLVQRDLSKADAIQTALRQVGITRYSRTSIAMAEIMDVLPVSEMAKLESFTDDGLRAIARQTSPDAEVVVEGALKHIRGHERIGRASQAREHWRNGVLLIRELRKEAEKIAGQELIMAGKEPTQEAIEKHLGGRTLSAYATHFVRQTLSDEAREELLERAAPWIRANHAEMMDTLERMLALSPDGSGIAGQGQPFILIRNDPVTGKEAQRFVSHDLTELMNVLFPGFNERFTTPDARNTLYQQLRSAFASERDRFKAVTKVIPDDIWVRFFQERRGGGDYELDFVQMLESYIPPVARKIHLEPTMDVVNGRVAQYSVGRPELRDAMHRYINVIMGRDKPHFPVLHRAAGWLTKMAYKGTLLGNFSAALTNFTQPFLFTIPEAGFRDSWAAIKLLGTPEWRQFFHEIGDDILMQVTPFEQFATQGQKLETLRRLSNAPNMLSALRIAKDSAVSHIDVMARVEYWNRLHAFSTGFSKALREAGIVTRVDPSQVETRVLEAAVLAGNRMIERTQFLFLSTSQPAFIRQINRLPGGQFLTMFSNFPVQATNRLGSWIIEAGNPETRAQGLAKITRAMVMGNIVAGPFWMAPWMREKLENDEDDQLDEFLKIADLIEDEYSIAGMFNLDLASKTAPASIVESALAIFRRTGYGGASLAGRAGADLTPIPRFISSGIGAFNERDPLEREILKGRIFGALAPLAGGKAPEDLPWWSIPPDVAPFVPGGVALNRFIRTLDVLGDPDRRIELEASLQLDERGRPRAVTTMSQEIRRQFGTPLEEMKIATRGRTAERRSEERKVARQTIKRFALEGRTEDMFAMLNDDPTLADALQPELLEAEAVTRSLLPQARAFRTMPEAEALARFETAAERLSNPRITTAERVLEEQIAMLGVARFRR